MARCIKLPSFRTAVVVSIATLGVFSAWAYIDLSFIHTQRLIAWDLRLTPIPEGLDFWKSHDRMVLPRFSLYVSLVLLAAGSL